MRNLLFTLILFFLVPARYELFCQPQGDSTDDRTDQVKRITFGGDLRTRLRNYDHINFGDVPDGQSEYATYLNMKVNLFTDVRVTDHINLHANLSSSHTFFKESTSASDVDLLSLSRVYANISFRRLPLLISLGRQEMILGSGSILGSSEIPNVAMNFDGVIVSSTSGPFTGTMFVVRPVHYNKGVFDNTFNRNNLMYGIYTTCVLKHDNLLDIFFFGNNQKDVTYRSIVADEARYTFGGRFYRETGRLRHETEVAWQTGRFGNYDIRAFQLNAGIGYFWEDTPLIPGISVRLGLFSGDRDSTDMKLEFFRPLYARPPVSSAVPVGPANLVTISPGGELTFNSNYSASLRYMLVWRYSPDDGLYPIFLDQLMRDPDSGVISRGMFVTQGISLRLNYLLDERIEAGISVSHFFAGEYISNTGEGKDVTTLFLSFMYSF